MAPILIHNHKAKTRNYGAFSWEVPAHCVKCLPWEGGSGFYNKANWETLNKLVIRIVPWLLLLLLLQFLPWLPQVWTMIIMCNSNECFPSQIASVHNVYHISGNKIWTIHLIRQYSETLQNEHFLNKIIKLSAS